MTKVMVVCVALAVAGCSEHVVISDSLIRRAQTVCEPNGGLKGVAGVWTPKGKGFIYMTPSLIINGFLHS